jgi:hypothetical protein
MNDRERRVGENEVLYRSINERIEDLNQAFGTLSGEMTVICECGDGACADQIALDVATYERVRSNPTHFIIGPGHDVADVEDVLVKHAHFWIVAKHPGEPASVAIEHDPRS